MHDPAGRVAFFADLRYDPKYKVADYTPPENLDVEAVLLGGDIEYRPEPLVKLIEEFKEKQRPGTLIVHIPGNEEHAGHDIAESKREYRERLSTVPNTVYLDNDVLVLPSGIRIIGTTLWDQIDEGAIEPFVRAIERVPGVEPRRPGSREAEMRATNALYLEARAWLEKELRKLTPAERERTIVVSHHWPTQRPWMDAKGEFPPDPHGIERRWFSAGAMYMDALLAEFGPKYWLCGHAHETKSVTIGRTIVRSNPFVGNQLGTINPDFDAGFVIEA